MKTILLIEDNSDIRSNIEEILLFANYKVLAAENGKIGVQLALLHKPDLIVCDILMPVMDGYSVINILQKNPETQHIPFIFLTAKTERDEIRKGMTSGADDYITKPFEEIELLNAVESRLKKIETLKTKFSTGLSGLNELINKVSGHDALKTIVSEHSGKLIKKKAGIYYENSYPLNLYYILKGTVKTFKVNEDLKELTVGIHGAGDFFGYTALLEKTNYKEAAETLEDSEIVIIPKKDFEELLDKNVEVLKEFVKILAGNVSQKEQHLLDIAYDSVRKKVAYTLITLCGKNKILQNNLHVLSITRNNLASIAGIAKETMIRTLTDFSDEKIISISNKDITVMDLNKLKNIIQ